MNKRKILSIIALVLVLLMLVSLCAGLFSGFFSADASSVSSMQKELEELAKKKEQLEKQLDVISEKKQEEMQKKSIIDEQINATQSEISVLNNIVSTLAGQLKDAESQLDEAEKTLNENLELSKNRIRSAYEQGEASYIEIILNSKSIYDFISKVEIVSQITARDREVINEVKASKAIIEQKREEIISNKSQNESALSQLSSKEKQLEKKQDASDKLIDDINSDAESTKRAVQAAERAEEQLQAEIRASLLAATSSVVDSGEFRWPLDSKYTNITSKFGYRTHPITGVYKLHSGVDIASSGIRGAKIYAAKGGTVTKAGYNTGYGNYVLIDHGDGYATLYGHASSLSVSTGMAVAKGDTLGYVGSTGYSTGPHLHFEVLHNGEYTNPLGYFSGIMTFSFS